LKRFYLLLFSVVTNFLLTGGYILFQNPAP
jgi:hypothetical protein